ncbi:maternal protein tudor-like isoform X3 [Harmonia axyridis]|uniref:maternal protein tudor-like isoform X3 n=2 Tax=Harmonia axyridis TaxID=115357 RepID=UPI001E2798A0|nr:maternal protein tudor-like isoform X3 [Harmonia axyridis]
MCDPLGMYITSVEKEGTFLKLWGQIDKKASMYIEMSIHNAYGMFEEGKHMLSPAKLQIGVLCCAKYIDEKYYRARIINDDTRSQGTVEVNFVDFGNRDLVSIANLRSIECFNETFINIQSLALPFILSEVICFGSEWDDATLEQISRQVRYMEVYYNVVSTHLGYNIVKISISQNDLASILIRNNLMQYISLENQESLLSEMIPRTPKVMSPADQSLLQYKSVTLEPNSRHEVYVSYITDGPWHFSVQLKKSAGILAQLMREINSIPLKPFDELPIPGTVCLAKCIEDNHICRAVITNEVDNHYKLFYVDFGNTEIVPPDNIYQMPFKYIIPKIMAVRLSLEGIDKSTVTLEMQCAFKQFVDNRLLMMEVFPSKKKMCLPKCRMWDPETNTDVLEILNKAAKIAYPSPITLHRGFTRSVKVTFVYSCNKFYIHLKSNEEELNILMAKIQAYCNSDTTSFLEDPKIDQPCCAQFAHDGQWYRSLIVAVNEDNVKVRYIDYGNEEDVPWQSLKTIKGELLISMRPQAIECCLNGYQNMGEDLERDNKLEELTLDQEFTIKVVDIVSGKALVDLLDFENCSVTSLLMDAMVKQKVQVSPNDNFENTSNTCSSNRNNSKTHDADYWSPRDKSLNRRETSENWRSNTSGRNNNWNTPEQDTTFDKENSQEKDYGSNNHSEWNGREQNRGRNRPPRLENGGFNKRDNGGFNNREDGGFGNRENGGFGRENGYNRNKNKNFDNWNTDNTSKTLGDDEEYQGVKKKRSFNGNNRSRTDNDDWGNKKNENVYNGNDYTEKKSYREKNSYDSDSSSKRGRQERNQNGRNKYNDRGDNRKKSYRKDHEFNSNDRERGDGKKFSPRGESRWTDNNHSKSFNSSFSAVEPKVIDAASDDAEFLTTDVNGTQKVTLSWFHNPCSFFVQLMDSQQTFSTMMEEIQLFYKDQPHGHCSAGVPAIALFPEDEVFYRSRILKNVGSQYKVYYVDFGNISVVDKVWPIDKKFMELPMQAVPCGLGGIQPVGNDWPDPNAFTNYLQKDSLDCEFLKYEVDRFMVNLYSNNEDIKEQLVRDNLAKYIELINPSPDFEICFLETHTFRAMVQTVNDLSDFTMSLHSGIQLKCSAHNLAQATEIYVEELKQKEGQVVVVYCDSLNGDRLEVTLYDHIGNKLNILNPDDGAFDSIEPVCPYLLLQSKVHGFVSVVNETSIVLQPSECADNLQTLLNEMYEHYQNVTQEAPLIPEEGYIYAVCSADSNWYRGSVISFNDDKVTVTYIDYGNTEDVTFSNLRELDPKFYWWDRMAILVHVNVPTADLFERQIVAQITYGDVGLVGEILEVEPDYAPEEAGEQPEMANINQEFSTNCRITEEPQVPVVTSSIDKDVEPQNISNQESSSAGGTAVVLSHIDSPSDFYIQLADSQDAIGELQSKLQEQIDQMPVLETASIGGLCAAPYSVDQMWYRSQILDADEDITTVRFIDYGNTDVIDNKTTQIKTLPAEFLALEEYATRCRLKIKPLEDEWSKAASDRFEELAYAESVTVQFVNQDEKANHVELFSYGENVKDLMIAENLAILDEQLATDPKLKGYISHMNSPSEFWVQLDGWCPELEWIAEQLSNASSFPDLEDFTPGSLCAAMFPDDEMWYRARILSNTVAGLEVLFLDYGNSCVCGNLKQLPEHLVMAPPLALKCSLHKPERLLSWSPESAKKFVELSADGQTAFTVKKLTTGETSVVELYVNDEEVSLKLLPTTEEVYVTDAQSMDSLVVSKQGVASDERYRLEKIPGFNYNQESVKKFGELNNEGKTLYGMELLEGNTIRLYINGYDIRKQILSVLQKELSEISQDGTSDINDVEANEQNIEVSHEEICSKSHEQKTKDRQVLVSEECMIPQEDTINQSAQEDLVEISENKISEKNDDTTQISEDSDIIGTIETEKNIEISNIPQIEQRIELISEFDNSSPKEDINEETAKEEFLEVSQNETSEIDDISHREEIIEEDASEVLDKKQAVKDIEISDKKESLTVSNVSQIIEELVSDVCSNPQKENIHELVLEESSESCNILKVNQNPEETEAIEIDVNYEAMDMELESQKESNIISNIADIHEEVQEIQEVCNKQTKIDEGKETEENCPEICDTTLLEKSDGTIAEEICDLQIEKIDEINNKEATETTNIDTPAIDVIDTGNHSTEIIELHEEKYSEACVSQQGIQIFTDNDKKCSELCDETEMEENSEEEHKATIIEKSNETIVICDSLTEKTDEINKEEITKTTNIGTPAIDVINADNYFTEIEELQEKNEKSSEVCDSYQEIKISNESDQKCSELCDETEIEGNSEEECNTTIIEKSKETIAEEIEREMSQEELTETYNAIGEYVEKLETKDIDMYAEIDITEMTESQEESEKSSEVHTQQEIEIVNESDKKISELFDETEMEAKSEEPCDNTIIEKSNETIPAEICNSQEEIIYNSVEEENTDKCDRLHEINSEPSTKFEDEKSTEKCDISGPCTPIEFTDRIMTSFSAPTVSEKESTPKLSPTKIVLKLEKSSGDVIDGNSLKLED